MRTLKLLALAALMTTFVAGAALAQEAVAPAVDTSTEATVAPATDTTTAAPAKKQAKKHAAKAKKRAAKKRHFQKSGNGGVTVNQ